MFGPELAIIANAMLFLAVLSLQLDIFDSDDATGNTDNDATPDLELLFNEDNFGETFEGTDGDDTAFSDLSNPGTVYDLLAGDDRMEGTENADFVRGGAGNDTLILFPGDDIALGGEGDDAIFAGRGDDNVDGGAGDDTIDGSLGDDVLYGNDGNDEITGGKGSDTVFGGAGDDVLSGSRLDSFGAVADGIDTLDGGSGNDTLRLAGADSGTGGSGEDTFIVFDSLEPGSVVTITDYNADQDQIELQHSQGNTPPELTVTFDAESNNAVVSLNGEAVLNVAGASSLTADQIALVPEL